MEPNQNFPEVVIKKKFPLKVTLAIVVFVLIVIWVSFSKGKTVSETQPSPILAVEEQVEERPTIPDESLFGLPLTEYLGEILYITFSVSPREDKLYARIWESPRESEKSHFVVADVKTGDFTISPFTKETRPYFDMITDSLSKDRWSDGTNSNELRFYDFNVGDIKINVGDFGNQPKGFPRYVASPDGAWLTNGVLGFVNIQDKTSVSFPVETPNHATLWYSDSKRILGCKSSTSNFWDENNQYGFTVWNRETKEVKALPISIPAQYNELIQCSTDALAWVAPDEVVVAKFGEADDGSGEGPRYTFIINLLTGKTTKIDESTYTVTDSERKLLVSVGAVTGGDYTYASIPNVKLYNKDGVKIGETIFEQPENIFVSRSSAQIVDTSYVLYIKVTEEYPSSHPAIYELVLLDLATDVEKVLMTGTDSLRDLVLLSDNSTWILVEGDKILRGVL